jgi:hypothetical protein
VTGEDELQREKRGDPQALGRRQPRQQVRRQGGQDREGQGQGARSEDRLDRLPTTTRPFNRCDIFVRISSFDLSQRVGGA